MCIHSTTHYRLYTINDSRFDVRNGTFLGGGGAFRGGRGGGGETAQTFHKLRTFKSIENARTLKHAHLQFSLAATKRCNIPRGDWVIQTGVIIYIFLGR